MLKRRKDLYTERNPKTCEKSLNLRGYEEYVDCIADNKSAIQAAEEEIAEARAFLDAEVGFISRKAREHGVFVKSLDVAGSNRSVSYLIKNSFSSLPLSHRSKIQEDLGEFAGELFYEEEKVSLRKDALPRLKELLGDRFEDFFRTDKSMKPVPTFRQDAFSSYGKMSEKQVEALEAYEDQLSHSYQMTVK